MIQQPPVLIFVNSIGAIEDLVAKLRQEQFHCCGIHSQYPQRIRDAIMRAFTEGEDWREMKRIGGLDILVTSSLLERGIDLCVDNVIIYEMPDTIEKFLHRAGRTGRADRKGTVTAFITNGWALIQEYRTLLRQAHQPDIRLEA